MKRRGSWDRRKTRGQLWMMGGCLPETSMGACMAHKGHQRDIWVHGLWKGQALAAGMVPALFRACIRGVVLDSNSGIQAPWACRVRGWGVGMHSGRRRCLWGCVVLDSDSGIHAPCACPLRGGMVPDAWTGRGDAPLYRDIPIFPMGSIGLPSPSPCWGDGNAKG